MDWNTQVRNRFSDDRAAGNWDDIYNGDTEELSEYFFRARCAFVLDYIEANCGPSQRILDLGCGTGPVISALRGLGYDCCGMDYSPDMLKRAQTRIRWACPDPTLLVRADGHRAPFRDGHFDVVACLGVISYLPDYSVLLKEIRRILRPGGLSIITFRNLYNPVLSDPAASVGYLARKLLGRNPGADTQTIGRFLSPDRVEECLADAGLRVLEFKGIGYGPFRLAGRKLAGNAASRRLSDAITRQVDRLGLRAINKRWTDVSMYIVRNDS